MSAPTPAEISAAAGALGRLAVESGDQMIGNREIAIAVLRAAAERRGNQETDDRSRLTMARTIADHWRRAAIREGWTTAAHALCCVLAALDGETDASRLGIPHGHPDAAALGQGDPCQTTGLHGEPVCGRTLAQWPCSGCPDR